MPETTIVLDDPDNFCFGCSPHNPHGLQLVWTARGREGVEAHYTVDPRWQGAPGVVHGGVQAALLDETIGVAIQQALPHEAGRFIVTVDFSLRYRRPVPTSQPIVLHGRMERHEGRDFWGKAEIRSHQGELLTTSSARWRQIPPPPDGARDDAV